MIIVANYADWLFVTVYRGLYNKGKDFNSPKGYNI